MDEKLIEYEPSYQGLMASSWNFIRGHSSHWADTPVYRQIIRDNGEPALDVGCGTGRILLQFLEEGLDVEGLDIAAEMLTICEKNAAERGLRPKLHCQPMESLAIDRKFRTIFVPSTSFVYVPTRAQVLPTLKGFFDHLEPGGKVVLSIADKAGEISTDNPRRTVKHKPGTFPKLLFEEIRPEDGATIQWWGNLTYDSEANVVHDKIRFDVVVDGHVIESEYFEESRLNLTWEEYEEGLKRAGFIDITIFGRDKVLGTRP